MSAVILPAGQDLIECVARIIEETGAPPGECLVVFPGKRPAHFLRRRLAAGRRGGFIPPRILAMDECVDAAFAAQEARAGRVLPRIDPIDGVALLYEIQTAGPQRLGGEHFMTLDSFYPIGARIWNDLEELFIEGVPARAVADVQPLVGEKVPERSRERLRTLAHFYEAFYAMVEERGFSTRSLRYRRAAERLGPEDLPSDGLLVIAGFYALTAAEQAFLRTVAAWPQTRLVFQDGPGLGERIKGIGASETSIPGGVGASQGAPTPRPETRFYNSPDGHGQIFALNAALEAPDDDTLIVVPKPDTLFPLLRHCLSRFDPESYNVSLPYPVQRTTLYGFFNDLMELAVSMDGERVYMPAYMTFTLHPYVKNLRLGASAEATRVLFHTLEERLAEERTRRFATLEEIEGDDKLFMDTALRIGDADPAPLAEALRAHLTDIHRRTLRRFRSFTSVGDFAERCIQLISWIHDASTASSHPYFTPFAEAFVRSLEAIARSLMADKSFTDPGSYFTLLRRYLAGCHVPFPGTPVHGMQVLGGHETRCLRFNRVFVLDANEGVLPETDGQASLLPFPVRAALKLPTAHDMEDVSAYHFGLLAAGARELHLFSLGSGESQRSRFAEHRLWDIQKEEDRESALDESRHVATIQYRVTLANPDPAAVEKTTEMADWLRGRTYSATTLDAYLRCPLEFYHRTVLALSQKEEATGEIESRDIGLFVHAVLNRYFAPRTGRPLSAEDADHGAIAALTREMFRERFGSDETGANRLLCNQISRRMEHFLEGYVRERAAGGRLELRKLEHRITTTRKGVALKGILDVVAELDGRPCLMDYKTSAKPDRYALRLDRLVAEDRGSWSKAVPTLQLPFYVLLHAAESQREPTEIQALFLLLGRTELNRGIEVPLFMDPTDAAAGWPRLEKLIDDLLAEIVSPDVPFTPARDLKAACPRCDFAGLCGTTWLRRA
jgi:ATP-dependent helicase/nuclease subunit B